MWACRWRRPRNRRPVREKVFQGVFFQEKMLENGWSVCYYLTRKELTVSDMIGQRHTFASYFAFAVDTILKVLWREGFARGPQELVTLTWYRIRRLERRFNALVAQWRAGTLPPVGAVLTPPPDPLRRAPSRQRDGNPDQGEGDSSQRAGWPFPRGR